MKIQQTLYLNRDLNISTIKHPPDVMFESDSSPLDAAWILRDGNPRYFYSQCSHRWLHPGSDILSREVNQQVRVILPFWNDAPPAVTLVGRRTTADAKTEILRMRRDLTSTDVAYSSRRNLWLVSIQFDTCRPYSLLFWEALLRTKEAERVVVLPEGRRWQLIANLIQFHDTLKISQIEVS